MHELNPVEQQILRIDDYVVVDAIAGIAAESSIQPGDIVIAINSQRISSIKQFRTVMAEVGMRAALLVQREDNMVFIPSISK